MSTDCLAFRRRLGALLEGRLDPPGLTALGWHEHLLGCGDCRAVLEQEQALELLLASLPQPSLPPDLTRRVLARLRAPVDELDALLDLDRVEVPAELAQRVREGVALATAEERLDALLDRLPAEAVPPGLAEGVLAALAPERARGRMRLVRGGWRAAAAALVLATGAAAAWMLSRPIPGGDEHVAQGGGPGRPEGPGAPVGPGGLVLTHDDPDEEVIALLPVLEYWDALQELDPLEQEIVTLLDVSDEALLDVEGS